MINISKTIHSLPEWAEKVMEPGSDFENLTLSWYAMWTATPELKKIRSGFLLKEMLDRFSSKAQSKLSPNRSLYMYFGHDSSLVDMLSSLGMYEVKAFLIHLFQNYDFEVLTYINRSFTYHQLQHVSCSSYMKMMKIRIFKFS